MGFRFWLRNALIMFSIIIKRSNCAFQRSVGWHSRRRPSIVRLSTGNTDKASLSMENLYREWTIYQDELLWSNKDKSPIELASLLGRGLRGVEARLNKLQDVSSPAYERLFANSSNDSYQQQQPDETTKTKLVTAGEVLRRIEFDYMLTASDFSVLHYDRVEDEVVESPLDAPNETVSGTETKFIKALPEHRIVGIKYKDRVVWDRNERMDLVFSGQGIFHVIETYEDWKRERDQVQEWNRKRQKLVTQQIRQVLGLENFGILQGWSSALQEATQDDTISAKSEIESYVKNALGFFRKVREDPTQSSNPSLIPMSDILALEELSELVAVLPDAELRALLLTEISFVMGRLEGKDSKNQKKSTKTPIVLSEDDLSESFVRGSGPGGQKVNKTSNRVMLVHEPTQLRVECQDTRSLQQNRKIARKRLLEKLDEHLNGEQSKVSLKHQKAAQKRQKSKTKNRSRQRKKQLEKQELLQKEQEPTDNFY
jgi:uncharacterized protein (UPF0248 family)